MSLFKKIVILNCLSISLIGCNSKEEFKRIGFNNLKLRLQMVEDTLGYSYMIMDKGNIHKFVNLDAKNKYEIIVSENDFRKGRYSILDSSRIYFSQTGFVSTINNCNVIPPIPFDLPEEDKRRTDSLRALPENVLKRNISDRIEQMLVDFLNDTCKIETDNSGVILKTNGIRMHFVYDSTECFN